MKTQIQTEELTEGMDPIAAHVLSVTQEIGTGTLRDKPMHMLRHFDHLWDYLWGPWVRTGSGRKEGYKPFDRIFVRRLRSGS